MVRALVLDECMQPVQIVGWQDAIKLVITERAEVIEYSEKHQVRSVSAVFKLPLVLKLFATDQRKHIVSWSRMNLFLRDGFKCAYCGQKKSKSKLTVDHVVPTVQGGKNTWENTVAACFPCNSKKGGRTPTQARMKLLVKPKSPAWNLKFALKLKPADPVSEWEAYVGDRFHQCIVVDEV